MEYNSLSSDLDKNLILFLTLCVGLCGPFTGGESWVNFSLSFCSPFSLSFTYSPQEWKNKTKHNAALCLIVCHHICLSREFFFFMFDCSQQWAYSFVLLTDTGDLESMKAEAQA